MDKSLAIEFCSTGSDGNGIRIDHGSGSSECSNVISVGAHWIVQLLEFEEKPQRVSASDQARDEQRPIDN